MLVLFSLYHMTFVFLDTATSPSWSQGPDLPVTITTHADIELLPYHTHTDTSSPTRTPAKAFREESDSDLSPDRPHLPGWRRNRERRPVRRAVSALETSSSPALTSFHPRVPLHMSLPQRFKIFHPHRFVSAVILVYWLKLCFVIWRIFGWNICQR
jgi:hypothetical protein